MSRGFTLLELLITILVIGALMVWAVPSYSSVSEKIKMERLAKELSGFVLMAKSEAVMRRERLWIHIVMSGATNSSGDWSLELTDRDTQGVGNRLLHLSGKPFDGITLSNTYTSDQISFDETHGRPKSGRISFHPINASTDLLEMRTYHRSAIVRVCSPNSALYLNYERC
ncbi:GspH/FimT family pseudopilin [Vibrio atypicus]|uniref:GspH/FimT family pseudopilin n=1 Tax=Vibrio atypicus TaxID=558271 RepID=UPI00135B5048|nr:GspH/FimT family pseudopilin [Vibrio atypicus]